MNSAVLDREPELATVANVEPAIIPLAMAQVLDLAKQTGATITPRELNEQLAQVLADYNALTTRFADHARQITEELRDLRQHGGALEAQMQGLGGDLQRQGSSLAVLAASTTADINAVRAALDEGLTDADERLSVQIEQLDVRRSGDSDHLAHALRGLEQHLDAQARIIQAQSARLDEFDHARELLDTAVRGNRKRIEAVREELDAQHTVVSAQVQGLAALHREHYAEFLLAKEWVHELQAHSQAQERALLALDNNLAGHMETTRQGFSRVHVALAIVAGAVLALAAAVKWWPAFTPAAVESEIALQRETLVQLDERMAPLPALEFRVNEHDGQLGQLGRSVSDLRQRLADIQAQLARSSVGGRGIGGAENVTPTNSSAVQDANWIARQPGDHFTIQLAGAADEAEALRVVERLGTLPGSLSGPQPLAHAVTYPGGLARRNLFLGRYATLSEARGALAQLPQAAQANRPWVRSFASVQQALR